MFRSRLFVAGLVVAAGLGFLLERLIVTDREAVRSTLKDAAAAASRNDWDAVKDAVHPDFSSGERNRDEFVAWAQRLWRSTGATRVEIDVSEIRVDGDLAAARVQVLLQPWNRRIPGRVDLVRRGGAWKLNGASPDERADILR